MKNVFISVLLACVVTAVAARAENSIPIALRSAASPLAARLTPSIVSRPLKPLKKLLKPEASASNFFQAKNSVLISPMLSLDHNLSDANIKLLKAKLKKHKIRAVNYGVVGGKNPEDWRKIFEFAKKMGLYGITTESVQDLDLVEKLVKKYNIHVGIHEHARRDDNPNYKVWDPNYVLSVVKDRDKRIGACADTGHWQTSGLDPLEGIKILKGRVISCHLKDKNEKGHEGHDVPYGTGGGRIKEILDELKAQGFKGNISIEYEYNWLHSVPEVKECVDFVKAYGKK